MTFIRLFISMAFAVSGINMAHAQDDLWRIDASELEDSSSPSEASREISGSIYDTLLAEPSENELSEKKPVSIYEQLTGDAPSRPNPTSNSDSTQAKPPTVVRFDPEAGRRFIERAQKLAAKREDAERAEQEALTDELLAMVKEANAAMDAYLAQPSESRTPGKKADTFLDAMGLIELEPIESEWDILVEHCSSSERKSEIACAWITEE